MKPLLKKLLKRDPEERHQCWADIIEKLNIGMMQRIGSGLVEVVTTMQRFENTQAVTNTRLQVLVTEMAQINQQNQAIFSYLKAQMPQIINFFRTIDAELKVSCPRFVRIKLKKLSSTKAEATRNIMTCRSNLAKTEVAISFICQHSYQVLFLPRLTSNGWKI